MDVPRAPSEKWLRLKFYLCFVDDCYYRLDFIDASEAVIEDPGSSPEHWEAASKDFQKFIDGIAWILTDPEHKDADQKKELADLDEKLKDVLSRGKRARALSAVSIDAPLPTPASRLSKPVGCKNCRAARLAAQSRGEVVKCMSCEADHRFTEFHRQTNDRFMHLDKFKDVKNLNLHNFKHRLPAIIEELGKTGEDGVQLWTKFCPVCVRNPLSCRCANIHLKAFAKEKSQGRTGSLKRKARSQAPLPTSPSEAPPSEAPPSEAPPSEAPPSDAPPLKSFSDDPASLDPDPLDCDGFTLDVGDFVSNLEEAMFPEEFRDDDDEKETVTAEFLLEGLFDNPEKALEPHQSQAPSPLSGQLVASDSMSPPGIGGDYFSLQCFD